MLDAYLRLSRIKNPVGFLLLWIPCLWGLSFQYDGNNSYFIAKESFLFLIAAISMRTVGCVINDCFDRDFDKKVERTKNRPIASGEISRKNALIFAFFCSLPGIGFFFHLDFHPQIFSIIGFMFACIYPLLKRVTYFPQVFLGITYNVGIWITSYDKISFISLLPLYIAGVFWTLAYDTIYAFQDIQDDIVAGVKSTAIKMKNFPKTFISAFYVLSFSFFALAINLIKGINGYHIFMIILCFSYLIYKIYNWNIPDQKSCSDFFKKNVYIGYLMALLALI